MGGEEIGKGGHGGRLGEVGGRWDGDYRVHIHEFEGVWILQYIY